MKRTVQRAINEATGRGQWKLARAATLVVAAYNASAREKAQADYVCRGYGDDIEINLALSLLAFGGILKLTAGTYYISADIVIPSYCTIEGMGNSTIITRPDSGTTMTAMFEAGYTSNKTDVVIRDLQIDTNSSNSDGCHAILLGKAATFTATRVLVENVYVSYSGSGGIWLNGGSEGIISKCTVAGAKDDSFFFSSWAHGSMDNCFALNGTSGSDNNGIEVNASTYVTVSNCYSAVGLAKPCYQIRNSGYVTISDSTYAGEAVATYGVYAYDSSHDITVNNMIGTGATCHIKFSAVPNGKVNGGIFRINDVSTSPGIVFQLCSNSSIIGANIYQGAYSYGISLQGTVQSEVLNNNIYSNKTRGIDVRISSTTQSRDILIQGNHVFDTTTNQSYGIYVQDGSYNIDILNNKLHGAATANIYIASTTKCNIRGNTGYLAPGELRTYAGSLSAGTVGYPVMAWQNPEAQDMSVTSRLYIGTGASAAAIGDMGRATTVAVLEDCEDVWNEAVDADITVAVDTTYVERGTNCVKFTVAATISDGDFASEAISSTDISTATYLTAKVRVTTAVAAGDLSILLDEHASCASPSFRLSLPAIAANTTTLVCVPINTVTPGAAAGATVDAVISIGLEYTANSKANTIYLDDIRAITVGSELFNDVALDLPAYSVVDSLSAPAPLYVGAKNSDDYDTIVMFSATNDTTGLVGQWFMTGMGIS